MFKKIYRDIFKDNIYRPDYISKSLIAELDCEQLLQNIIELSKPNELCKNIRKIIVKKCSFIPTEIDGFDLKSDDRLQKNRLNIIDKDEDTFNVFSQLFDGISLENIKHILSTKN